MTAALGRFIARKRLTPGDSSTELLDAATGTPVAAPNDGESDIVAMVDHGRTVGYQELVKLTFHQRALIHKTLTQHLMSVKNSLYPLSFAPDTTKADSWIDIAGGIRVLYTYGSKGRRGMPNDTVYLDSPAEQLGKARTFVGQHAYMSLLGLTRE